MTINWPLIKKNSCFATFALSSQPHSQFPQQFHFASVILVQLSRSKAQQFLIYRFKVGSNSTTTSLQCLCNHLTSFGGGILVMPNKLDFDVVFTELTRIHETGNVAVLCTIIAALLLYFLVCVFARRADKKDRAKVRMNYLCLQLRLSLQQIIPRLFSSPNSHCSKIGIKSAGIFALFLSQFERVKFGTRTMCEIYRLLHVKSLGPVSRKSRNFSGEIILFVSSKRRCSMSRNFAAILIVMAFRISGSEFYELLFGLVKFSGLLRNERVMWY